MLLRTTPCRTEQTNQLLALNPSHPSRQQVLGSQEHAVSDHLQRIRCEHQCNWTTQHKRYRRNRGPISRQQVKAVGWPYSRVVGELVQPAWPKSHFARPVRRKRANFCSNLFRFIVESLSMNSLNARHPGRGFLQYTNRSFTVLGTTPLNTLTRVSSPTYSHPAIESGTTADSSVPSPSTSPESEVPVTTPEKTRT